MTRQNEPLVGDGAAENPPSGSHGETQSNPQTAMWGQQLAAECDTLISQVEWLEAYHVLRQAVRCTQEMTDKTMVSRLLDEHADLLIKKHASGKKKQRVSRSARNKRLTSKCKDGRAAEYWKVQNMYNLNRKR